MADDLNKFIYAGEPVSDNPEQEAAERELQLMRQAMLPKFELEEGEKLYIPREKIAELNVEYFKMWNEMCDGLTNTNEVMRSYMESVLFASYKSAIEGLQKDGGIKGKYESKVYEKKQELLNPKEIKYGWRGHKKWKNEAMKLCEKEAAIEAKMENSARREIINRQKQYLDGDELSDTAWSIAYEFTTPKKYNRFKDRNRNYFTWLLTDYAGEHNAEEIYDALVKRFVKEKKRKKFNEQNEDYIKGLLIEFLRSFSEPEEEPEPVPDSKYDGNAEEEPQEDVREDAGNAAGDGAEEEPAADKPAEADGDLNDLQALETELEEAPEEEPQKDGQKGAVDGELDKEPAAEELQEEAPANKTEGG